MEPVVLQVSEFAEKARLLVESEFDAIWLTGEISNLATPASGHIYFSLKDERAQIRCAMFRNRRIRFRGTLENGDAVVLSGTASIYEARGDFQLIVDYIEPAGEGELRRRYELLKKKLENEGLFDPSKRRPIPSMPKTIGVITSGSGAALHDIRVTLARRFPLAEVLHFPVSVQGENAAPEIVEALERINQSTQCDVAIVARGGGSLEDLWAFNEESVVRAIRRSRIPVVTGVGHETDITLADYAADWRAATPTAAAESVTPDAGELLRMISSSQDTLEGALRFMFQTLAQKVDSASARLRHPRDRLAYQRAGLRVSRQRLRTAMRAGLTALSTRLSQSMFTLKARSPQSAMKALSAQVSGERALLAHRVRHRLLAMDSQLDRLEGQLRALSPIATLERGFAIVETNDHKIVRSSRQLTPGASFFARFASGSVSARVDDVQSNPDTEPGDSP